MHAGKKRRKDGNSVPCSAWVCGFSPAVCLHPSGSGSSVLPWVPPPVQPPIWLGFSFKRPAMHKNSSHHVFSRLLRRLLDGCVIPLCYKVCMCHFWTPPHHWHIAASPVYLIHGFRLSAIQRFYMTWWGRWCNVLGSSGSWHCWWEGKLLVESLCHVVFLGMRTRFNMPVTQSFVFSRGSINPDVNQCPFIQYRSCAQPSAESTVT